MSSTLANRLINPSSSPSSRPPQLSSTFAATWVCLESYSPCNKIKRNTTSSVQLPIQKYYKRNVPSLDVVAVQDERRAHEQRDEEDPVVRAVRRDDGLDGTSKWRQEVLRGLNDGRGKGGRGRWRTSRVSVPVSHRWEKRSPRLIRDGSEMGTMTRGLANGSAPRRECRTRSRGKRAPAPCAPPVQCVPRARDTELRRTQMMYYL